MAVESFQTQRVYVKAEASFNAAALPTFAATDAIIAKSFQANVAHNRVPSKSKRGTPDVVTDLPRMQTSGFDLLAEWRPSGSIGVESDLGPLLKAFFGTQTAHGSGSGVATTIASGPSVTGAVLTSATGLAVGAVVWVTLPSGAREATRIKTLVTNTVTWDALSTAPAVSAAVVASVTYSQTTAVGQSLAIGSFFAGKKELITGGMADQIEITFGKHDEVTVRFSGMSARHRGNTAASSLTDPASTTTVGSPINGIVAAGNVNGFAFKVTALKLSMANAIGLRDQELGDAYATEAYRSDFRMGTIEATFYLDDGRIADLGAAFTKAAFSLSIGSTNGAMLGIVAPSVLWDEPALPSGESGPVLMTVKGQLYATSGNDSLFVAE